MLAFYVSETVFESILRMRDQIDADGDRDDADKIGDRDALAEQQPTE